MPYNEADPDHVAFVDAVRYRIDQTGANGQTVPVNAEGIYAEGEKSARKVLRTAPKEIALFAATSSSPTPAAKEGGSLLPLPADFLRFLRVESGDWDRSVTDLLPDTSNIYRVQANPNSRVDATRPIGVLISNPGSTPNQALHVYPSVSAATLHYVGVKAPEDMPEDLEDALLWYTAGAVLANTNEPQWSKEAFDQFARVLSGLRVGLAGEEG